MALLLGVVLLVGFILLARWYATASPGAVLRNLRWAGLFLAVVALVLLAVTGRLNWLFAAFAALLPWFGRALRMLPRIFGLLPLLRMIQGLGGGMAGPAAGTASGRASSAGRESSGQTSSIETPLLRMFLDHATGRVSGEVLSGSMAGRRLEELTEAEGLALLSEAASDEQSRQLVEAWLDRTWPEWRERTHQDEASSSSGSGPMTREEALAILGLSPGATPEDIKAAHRRLMAGAHPDRGGSSWLAAKLNEARDLLLST
ncbi:molecular chaperone DnaJ [Telmatospirillum sp. J64-1]|uniref:molecular chaperone DnaJ n=1 Tax=Telmatospirillum sp. J64-1 TaxID=2502183 RepID=UPI00115E3442|nr:molecular chaperone DnaJ [Telmatospirillum sp. J64-1]